ncbi:hypothetical protein [Marisediminicola sp. LYQ134]|uniref:hypothetical protein n=1 Tax=Marisediminicola sp. LYQ134 TaxID=3391061 RepID=UPI00398380CF
MLQLEEFSPGKSGQVDAVRSLKRAQADCLAAVGSTFYINPWQDFVRSVATQVALLEANYFRSKYGTVWWDGTWWTKYSWGVVVATPGASDHQRGIAADISFDTAAARTWFRANCWRYQWTNDGDNFGEDWHKKYIGPTTTIASIIAAVSNIFKPKPKRVYKHQEDDMLLFNIGKSRGGSGFYIAGINDAEGITQSEATAIARAASGTGKPKYKDGTDVFRKISPSLGIQIIEGVKRRRTRWYKAQARATGREVDANFDDINRDLDELIREIRDSSIVDE